MRNFLYIGMLSLLACGKKPGSYEIKTAAESSVTDNLSEKAEAQWQNRSDKAELEAALASYETLFAQDPTNREVATRLVRGWYFYGDAYEPELEAKKTAWDKAITFGMQCLSINEEYAAILAKEGKREDAAKALGKDDVPCAYWTASALGKWAKSSGLATTLKHIGAAKAYIAQVEVVEPTYFHGAVNRYWGAYYSGLPSFAGQDLERSKNEFDKSIEISTDYLGTRVLLADYWATKNQEQIAVFDEQLQYVIASDVNALDPELIPENLAEIEKAKKLLAQRSDKFIDAPAIAPLQMQPPVVPPVVEEVAVEEAPADVKESSHNEDGTICDECNVTPEAVEETVAPEDSTSEPAENAETKE